MNKARELIQRVVEGADPESLLEVSDLSDAELFILRWIVQDGSVDFQYLPRGLSKQEASKVLKSLYTNRYLDWEDDTQITSATRKGHQALKDNRKRTVFDWEGDK